LADIGGIAVTENEGNVRLCTSFAKTHIAIAGIEKVLPSVNDLGLFWPLLATYSTGENLAVYNTILTGPKRETEIDGPDEMYVILLDNGRTNLLTNEAVRESLYCIRCGACLNASPVYKNIGGHTYGTTYSGTIGAVITPHLKEMKEYKHLSYASPLSGEPTEACPLKINLHELLLENRHEAVKNHLTGKGEKVVWQMWKRINLSRKMMNLSNSSTKSKMIRKMFGKGWGERRDLPDFAPKSFNELWKEKTGNKS
ncbi:MAG: LUD domain-containing protein, partial [Chitinophagaceae bacterium]